MIEAIVTFFSIWLSLSILATWLIFFRSDSYTVLNDVKLFTDRKKMILKLIGLMLLLAVLPLSIPYSIANIIKKK